MQPSDNNPSIYTPQPTYHVKPSAPERPTGVTVLAILKLLSVVLAIAVIWLAQIGIQQVQIQQAAAASRQSASSSDLLPELQAITSELTSEVYASRITALRITQAFTVLDIPLGLLFFWGLWTMRPWARKWTIGFAWLSVGLGVVGMCLAGELSLPLSIALNGVVIWYLMRQDVQDAFDPGSI